jgi:hypothetical protein
LEEEERKERRGEKRLRKLHHPGMQRNEQLNNSSQYSM